MPGRILIADTVPTTRITMKVMLNAACYDVFMVGDGHEVIDQARTHNPDLILLDSYIDGPGVARIAETLRADPELAHIALAVIGPDAPEARLAAFRAGAESYLTKPVDCVNLRARVRGLLRMATTGHELKHREDTARALGFAETAETFTPAANIVLVGAKVDSALKWRAGLTGLLSDTITVQRRDMVLHGLQNGPAPDLYVLSSDFSEGDDGLRLLSELRARGATRDSAIVVRYPPEKREKALFALDLGADDIIANDRDPEEFALRLKTSVRRKREADRLRQTIEQGIMMASIDPLTGLYNRRFALPRLDAIAEEARQQDQQFAVMLVDIDRFKSINDRFGHSIGDEVLVEVARRLRDNLRSGDLVARIGGEEFLVALPNTSLVQARQVAERLRCEVYATPATLTDAGKTVTVSVSIGLAMCSDLSKGQGAVSALIDVADTALYASKAEGRNQVTLGAPAA